MVFGFQSTIMLFIIMKQKIPPKEKDKGLLNLSTLRGNLSFNNYKNEVLL